MSEFYLTLIGLAVAAVAGAYSIWTDKDKPASAKSLLLGLTVVGLAVGGVGAKQQASDTDKAQKQLDEIEGRVGTVANLDDQIQRKTTGLTALDQLGGKDYYVVIDTFQNNDRSKQDFQAVKHRLLSLFPEAEKSGMLWEHPVSNGQYELRFGRNLSLTSAETYRRLASYGIANGNPLIRREQ